MAEKSLFFNALPDDTSATGYDRNYNADDISDWLSSAFETGVIKTNLIDNEAKGLKVEAAEGKTIHVNAGKAAIKGKAYINNAIKAFTIGASPTGQESRYDLIVLRYDNNPTKSGRKITLELKTGTSAIPTAATLERNDTGTIYELLLAYIEVKPGAEEIEQADIKDTRGDKDLCPWFTAVKGYEDYYDAAVERHEETTTVATAATTVISNISSSLYNSRYSLVSVYTNGIKEPEENYTINTSGAFITATFTSQRAAGAKVTFILENFIDGEGMTTALNDYNTWKAAVAKLETANEYTYVCNGENDNVLISNIVRTFYNTNDYKSAKIRVVGNIGFTAPFGGGGTSSNPYAWFDFSTTSTTNRTVTVDFTNCSEINPTITDGTYNVIFKTNNIKITGANIIASNTTANTNIRAFNASSGSQKIEDCRIWITGYKDSLIALNGTFTNCRGSVANVINNSYCFLPSTSALLKIYGGEYYAYTGSATNQSSIIGQSSADSVSILYGVSAPTAARSGFYQTNSILQWAGGGILSCTDLISTLPMIVVSGISNIRGTIEKNKTNVW